MDARTKMEGKEHERNCGEGWCLTWSVLKVRKSSRALHLVCKRDYMGHEVAELGLKLRFLEQL